MYQRFIYDEMPGAFNVALNTMPDLESYLLNMDDDQIGNPDDPEVKRLQMLMNKTILGSKLWKDLENSTKTVYFKFHNGSKNPNDLVGVYLRYKTSKIGATAVTMTLRDYNYIKENGDAPLDSFDKNFTFNEKTGLYNKTAEWDKTVIAFDVSKIKLNGYIISQTIRFNSLDEDGAVDAGMEASWITTLAHEIQHAVNQSYADLDKKDIDPTTGKYKKPNYSGSLSYHERINEIEAEEIGEKVKDELIDNILKQNENKK